MITLEQARELLQIDKNRLDDMLMDQGDYFEQVYWAYAVAVSKRDAAKERIADVDATVANRLRETLPQEGKKVTDKSVAEYVQMSEGHEDAYKRYLEKKLEADKWNGMMQAWMQRASALKYMCELWIASYYSKSTVTSNIESGKDMEYEKARKKLKSNRKPKR